MAKSQAVNLPGDAKLAHKNSEPTDQIEAELKRAMTEHFALTFIVKNRAGDIWSTTISSSSLVSDLEDQVREEAQLPPDSIVRLIHQGKILDSERTVASYNLPDGSVLYFSVGKRPPEPVKAAARVQPEDFKSRLIKQVAEMIKTNPEAYIDMLKMNPAFQDTLERNPVLQHALNDSELLQQQVDLASEISTDAVARNLDSMLAHVEALPGGFRALTRTVNEIQDPLLDGLMDNLFNVPVKTNLGERPNKPCENPLPNIGGADIMVLYMQSQFVQVRQAIKGSLDVLRERGVDLVSLPGMEELKELLEMSDDDVRARAASIGKPRFAVQLRQMEESGFSDREANLRELEATGGNVGLAIARLRK